MVENVVNPPFCAAFGVYDALCPSTANILARLAMPIKGVEDHLMGAFKLDNNRLVMVG